MNKLTILEKMGFKITWKLIYIGLTGSEHIPIQISRDELFDFLDKKLIAIYEQTDNIILLICEKNNAERVDSILKKLADNESSARSIQLRKWRAFTLKNVLDNLNSDYLQGLLQLMEFWTSMGIPEDCPQAFPKQTGELSVNSYFTPTMYSDLIAKNNRWLSHEITNIIAEENK